ncbi:hypothetical protein Lnau_2773 [Legionella nautarum]|uniref:Uncharacterized protein n=1 Tax=Legionella nautarum TaxID=45070 RepID=A0A0W0WLB2_9GAMM|nr:hypothetical protein [Legionella nautarum]KTD33125.1 hypothetical protein Lnau_2773 [Legionella nautarum]
MSHLSIRELNRIVEIATEMYAQGKKATNAFDYLSACKGFDVRPDAIPEKNNDSEEIEFDREDFQINYNHQTAINAFTLAEESADSASENPKEVFAAALKENLRGVFILQNPIFSAINEIDQHLQEFRSPANWFKRSARDKIAALETLKQRLLEGREGTIGETIASWMEQNRQIIASSRNLLKMNGEDPQASTLKFINGLLPVYGEVSLEEDYDDSLSRQAKQKIYQPLLNYIQARTTWFQQILTFIFRNTALSNEKLVFAQDLIEKIQDSKDSYSALDKMLRDKRNIHAHMSEEQDLNHYNLRAPRELPQTEETLLSSSSQHEERGIASQQQRKTTIPFWQRAMVVEEGEMFTKSDLAEALHESIEMTSMSM